MPSARRLLLVSPLALAAFAAAPAAGGLAATMAPSPVAHQAQSVELLKGTVRSAAHDARGRAAVVKTGSRRTLTLRNFRIDPGPRVRVYLVPRGVRRDGAVRRDFRDLGGLKGNRGNQQYAIPGSVDLRRYNQVIFWCVPFTQTLARAQLERS